MLIPSQCDGKENFKEIVQLLKCQVQSHMLRIVEPIKTGQKMKSEACRGNPRGGSGGGIGRLIRIAMIGTALWVGGCFTKQACKRQNLPCDSMWIVPSK